jgi:hypothetical protein
VTQHEPWEGTVSEAATHLTSAYRLLERLGGTSPRASGQWTFFELDDAIRCVIHALLALDARP